MTEERISELEDKSVEIIQSEKHKKIKENEQSLKDLWDSIKHNNICRVTEREKGGKVFEEVMVKKILNLMGNINLFI